MPQQRSGQRSIQRPPSRANVKNPNAEFRTNSNRRRKKKKRNGKIIALIWAVVIAAVVAFAVLYFTGAFKNADEVNVGEKFIKTVISGDFDGAFKMLPYDAKKFYGDNWRAEYRDEFGSDFNAFYKKYRYLGLSATDIESFIDSAYSKLTSDFRLGNAALAGNNSEPVITAGETKKYTRDELNDFLKNLKASFSGYRVNIEDYLDFDSLMIACEVPYTVEYAGDGVSQTCNCTLRLLEIGSTWYVMPINMPFSAGETQSEGLYGSWKYDSDGGEGSQLIFKFNSDGSGSVTASGKTVPLTFELIGTDGMSLVCDALVENTKVSCRYSIEMNVLTLTLPDGTMKLTRVIQ